MENNTFHFNIFSQFNGLIHGISTRYYSSMKDQEQINFANINEFLKTLNINPDRFILPQQVHGSNCVVLNEVLAEKIIKDTDGLIAANKNIFIGVLTADCLPILFYDSGKNIVGIAHGGYKGLSSHIIKEIIGKFRALGSDARNLWVGIGPAVGSCCYNVPGDRIEIFQKILPLDDTWYKREGDQFFMDLKKIALLLLKDEGVLQEHIEVSDICTSHQIDRFFSYRKDGKRAGRFASIIGLI